VWAHAPTDGKPCRDCHEDKHFGEFKQDCAGCHELAAWSPAHFDHATAAYKLEGKHVATPCRGCHASKTSFVVGGTACLDCHQSPHGADKQGACETCHTANNWGAWKIASHSYPLTGAHANTACAGCHPGSAKAKGTACKDCHADVHAGQFVKRCDGCHTTASFRAPQPHALPLTGAHQIACAKCHPQTTLRNGDQVTRYALGYRACKDCHASPHPKIKADCAGCHAATTWAVSDGAKLDHDPTGFPLRGQHATTKCSACHATSARPETACESCHKDPHAGRMDGACAECHTAVAWHDTETLTRHRQTRLPLTGAHATLDCSACHKRQAERTWRDAPADCWSCHADDSRALPSHATYGRGCAKCHNTITWAGAVDTADRTEHPQFEIARGAHATTACAGCHVAQRVVRCDGCHATHPTPVSKATSACLGCHPRGARR
jgi:hypothetical protein